jgi:hypothetical protein
VDAFSGVAHIECVCTHKLLGEEARVGVCVETHRVTTHVLDSTGDADLVRAKRDAARNRRHGRHSARTHAVDGVAGNAPGQPGEQCGSATERQSLVARLGSSGDRYIVDAVFRQGRIALK